MIIIETNKGPIKVYNKKTDKFIPKNAIYVGRPSKWGNNFTHLNYGLAKNRVKTPEEAVEAHRNWLYGQTELIKELPKLEGKDLICWCVPNPCHAVTLVLMANNYKLS